MTKLKVYYNGACPVCDAGIRDQRKRMQSCSADVEWIDIDDDADAVNEIGAEREYVRERLHVVDGDGQVRIGADAFEALWRQTDGQKWLARLLRNPLVRILAQWSYNVFAAGLYGVNRVLKRWVVEK